MSPVRASSFLLSCCVFILLIVGACRGQGSDCSCNVTNSSCDESGACRCDPGWGGERCERCGPRPGCLHGSCQQPWQCSCEPGWGGRFCDKRCAALVRMGAACVMEDSGRLHLCVCPRGSTAEDCQLKTGPCYLRRSPCKNGGLCEDGNGFAEDLSCRCLAGFTGRRCETDMDDCLMRPCANGATCVDGTNHFSCICPAGFTGRFCTVNLDDCASRPCLHAGRCLDGAGGFHCVCRPGYTGATCETEEGGRNASRHGDSPFRVTVSERSAAGLSDVQLIVLLVLAGVTLAVVVLTGTVVLHGHCRARGTAPCCPLTSSQQPAPQDECECHISFLNVAVTEKKKLNSEVI
nr:LOW QUALITY PROTEIN: protein delta homolog 2 [Gasterosteus aculeatus aculeatus]